MPRTIADGEVRVVFADTVANTSAPTAAEVGAGDDITPWMSSLDTPLDGDSVDSSDLSSAFNKSVAGTYGGGASATLYRDDTADTAWGLFPRNVTGYIIIRRFGGSDVAIIATNDVEVWYVRVITESPATMDRNNVQTFDVDFAVLEEPVMDAVVA
jgi:hypothetical protein